MTWRGRNIYLVGLPGSGKSAIGREVADRLANFSYAFVDLDKEIERSESRSIADIFTTSGEEQFRSMETEALQQVSRDAFTSPKVVATGGGIVLRPINRTMMSGSGLIVWIDVNVREAAYNILRDVESGRERPLINANTLDGVAERVRSLYEERRPFYEQATLTFVYRNPNGSSARSPSELADELVKALNEMSFHVGLRPPFETLIARSNLGDYPVHVGNGIASKLAAQWIEEEDLRSVVIVTDENVAQLHLEEFTNSLTISSKPLPVTTITIAAGERSKTLTSLEDALRQLSDAGASRRTTGVITLGGGVVTDLGGLAANLYQRGLKLAHVPTTLLAQIDAAIGGKTGVDAFGAKNSIGTFYAPKAVIVDPLFLRTLPIRELRAGVAELIKCALIGDRELWSKLTVAVRRLTKGVDPEYPAFITQAIEEKLKYVDRDELEHMQGVRELLNFGHTFGHALESATGFATYLHGEAVLLGMRTAAWLSERLGYLSTEQMQSVDALLSEVPIEPRADVTVEQLLSNLRHDKKRTNATRCVILKGVGEAFVADVADEDLVAALHYLSTLAQHEHPGYQRPKS